MTNPIPDATKFLKSLNYEYRLSDNTLHFEHSAISIEPQLDAVDCTRATMQMKPIANPAGVRNSFLLFVVVNAVMGKDFDIEGFFAKFNKPPFAEVIEMFGGVRVTFTPEADNWIIDFVPAQVC